MNPFLLWGVVVAFDRWLKKRRRARAGPRLPIPVHLRRRILRLGCQWPSPPCHAPADHVHHRLPVSEGGTNDPSNLVGLCREHHVWTHGDGKRNARAVGILLPKGRPYG